MVRIWTMTLTSRLTSGLWRCLTMHGVVGAVVVVALCLLVPCCEALNEGPAARQYVDIPTKLGRLKGYRENVLGKDIDIFLGIPFAKPPVGDLRFQRPETYGAWQGTYDATHLPAACMQAVDGMFDRFEGVDMWNPNTNISEDCLFLNIWAPATSHPKAVMVWIYGGSFASGSSALEIYDGRILAAEGDVVVVSMQYRMGPLGFLYLGLPEAPGNMGLLDQVLAVQWTFNYIDAVHGDNDKITLIGESAGASSVSLHLLSDMTAELVHSGIMQSSSALAKWAVDLPKVAKKRSLQIAKKLKCTDSLNVQDVLMCLRKADGRLMVDKQWLIQDKGSNIQTPLVPTLDGYFLKEHPYDILAGGDFHKKPILIGTNKDEGAYFLPYMLPSIFKLNMTSKVLSREEYIQSIRQVLSADEDFLINTVAFEYGEPYPKVPRASYRDLADDILGDSGFICPVVNLALYYAQSDVNVYMYRFMHRTSHNPWPKWLGVMHGYEIDHVFGHPLNDSKGYHAPEKALSTNMVKYWSNFAKTGDPNLAEDGTRMSVLWPTYTTENHRYMKLNLSLSTDTGIRERKCAFWRDLVPKLRFVEPSSHGIEANPEYGYKCGACAVTFMSRLLCVLPVLLLHQQYFQH